MADLDAVNYLFEILSPFWSTLTVMLKLIHLISVECFI